MYEEIKVRTTAKLKNVQLWIIITARVQDLVKSTLQNVPGRRMD